MSRNIWTSSSLGRAEKLVNRDMIFSDRNFEEELRLYFRVLLRSQVIFFMSLLCLEVRDDGTLEIWSSKFLTFFLTCLASFLHILIQKSRTQTLVLTPHRHLDISQEDTLVGLISATRRGHEATCVDFLRKMCYT